ncbi:hypothetical protein ALP76_200004 [Pseudomonas savastanoi pv. glycinea]|nr:hypothetical protein ALP76_200004 [Pseudomonas savastanoi pv. glycinea]
MFMEHIRNVIPSPKRDLVVWCVIRAHGALHAKITAPNKKPLLQISGNRFGHLFTLPEIAVRT